MTNTLNWKHLDFSKADDVRWILGESGIPELAAEALVADDSQPRAVPYENGLLVILRGVNLNPGADLEDMISVRLWLESDRVVSTARRPLRSIGQIADALASGAGPDTPVTFLETLAEKLTGFIAEAVERMEDDLDAAETAVSDHETIVRNSPFSRLRRQSTRVRRYMAPQRDALSALSKQAGIIPEGHQANFRELAHGLTLVLENLELVREHAMIAQEEFLAVLAHEQNTRMLLLSIIAAIFLPLSFLTGLMGMNVAGLPGTEFGGAFWLLVGVMGAATVAILALFRYQRWI